VMSHGGGDAIFVLQGGTLWFRVIGCTTEG